MSKKLTAKEAIEFVNSCGSEIKALNGEYLTDDNYTNARAEYLFKCVDCGEWMKKIYYNFKTGTRRCESCGENHRLLLTAESKIIDFNEIVNLFRSLGSDIKTIDEEEINVNNWNGISFLYKIKCIECGKYVDRLPNNFITHRQHLCWECGINKRANTRRETNEQYLLKLKNKNIDIIPMEEYKGSNVPIKHKCPYCGNKEWNVSPNDILNNHSKRCSLCYKNKKKTTEEFIEEVFKLVKNEYSILSEYITSHDYITMKHNKCNKIYPVSPTNFLKGCRCPYCTISLGETAVKEYLDNNYFNYETQYRFKDLLGNYLPLKFDFSVFINNKPILIEFNGEQHYRYIEGFHTYKDFLLLQEYDKRKIDYCKNKGLKLIIIPYTHFKKINNILKEHLI